MPQPRGPSAALTCSLTGLKHFPELQKSTSVSPAVIFRISEPSLDLHFSFLVRPAGKLCFLEEDLEIILHPVCRSMWAPPFVGVSGPHLDQYVVRIWRNLDIYTTVERERRMLL